MQSGTWALRCQACDTGFDVRLENGQLIVEFLTDTPCPNCKKKPTDDPPTPWHEIVGFDGVTEKPN